MDRRGEAERGEGGPPPPGTARVRALRWTGGRRQEVEETVAREQSLVVLAGGAPLLRLQCSPGLEEELVLGVLFGAGAFERGAPLPAVRVEAGAGGGARAEVDLDLGDERRRALNAALAVGSACGLGFVSGSFDPLDCRRRIDPSFRLDPAILASAMREFEKRSALFAATGGVHAAGILAGSGIAAFAEDVGRYNAVDKAVGLALKAGLELADKTLLLTARVSLDMAAKCVRAGVAAAASPGAPTDAAAALAREARLVLAGFVRGGRMNIYAGEERIRD